MGAVDNCQLIGMAMTFYQILEKVLNERGMTPSEICAKTGLHPSYLSKLKSGHTKDVTWEKALLIISALDLTPNDFLRMSGDDD